MRYLVTGCAGFIGSHLTDRLLQLGHEVIGIDNFSSGFHEFLQDALQSPRFTLHNGNILDEKLLLEAMVGVDRVFHMAANADVRYGIHHPYKDLEQNTLGTYHVLEAMRKLQIKAIAFASTGSIYGEHSVIPTPESASFPTQTSLYGASKLAAEGLIQAYSEAFGIESTIFRFVSILGERYTHGHVFDFYKQLLQNPNQLTILGNGKQQKSYLYIHDCIDAMLIATNDPHHKVNIYNLGTHDYCTVTDSIHWICQFLKVNPEHVFTGGERGWIGDNPFIWLDTTRIQQLGWKPKLSIQESIVRTIEYLSNHQWVLEKRI